MSLWHPDKIALSRLKIDTSKDWLGYLIKNLGVPVDVGDALRKGTRLTMAEMPDGTLNLPLVGQGAGVNPAYTPLPRAGLEYPTVDVTFAYLACIGKLVYGDLGVSNSGLFTSDSFADKALKLLTTGQHTKVMGRWVDANNMYEQEMFTPATTADHKLEKCVAGTWTTLATEAVDITDYYVNGLAISCSSTTLKAFRNDFTTARLTVTDSSFSSGKFGYKIAQGDKPSAVDPLSVELKAPMSAVRKTLGYYEVPIIGSGTETDPYRAQLPENLEAVITAELDGYDDALRNAIKANRGGLVNRIAVSHASLIPTDPVTGKPFNPTCIIRIYEQPDRQPHLWRIAEALDKIESIPAVKKLDIVQAKRRVKELDKRLTDKDLESW
jgi:hypothetical protein